MIMGKLIGSKRYCLYRGRQYAMRGAGMDRDLGECTVVILPPEDSRKSDFPDAVQTGGKARTVGW